MLIYMINDKALYNQRYRSALISELEARDYEIKSLGLKQFLSLFTKPRAFIISSNLKTNLVMMVFFWLRGMTIINGLGRYRRRKAVRTILRILFRINSHRAIVVQSYADFRYFRRFVNINCLYWVPGSGGIEKQFGAKLGPVSVQRDDKIETVAASLKHYLNLSEEQSELSVVGCKDIGKISTLFDEHRIHCPGYVPANEILMSGSTFVQPSGYGEGFPHTFTDAIVSGMAIHMTRQDYVRYGLYKFETTISPLGDEWVQLHYGENLRNRLTASNISERYIDIFEDKVKR